MKNFAKSAITAVALTGILTASTAFSPVENTVPAVADVAIHTVASDGGALSN